MPNDLEAAVALRLRAVMKAFQIESYPQMADICQTTPSNVGNWCNAYALPRIPEMIRLCERTGITLDWVYRGSIHKMDAKLAISLGRIIDANRKG